MTFGGQQNSFDSRLKFPVLGLSDSLLKYLSRDWLTFLSHVFDLLSDNLLNHLNYYTDHRPLELHELLVRQLAEILGQPVEQLESEPLVPLATARSPYNKERKNEERKNEPHRTAVEPK